MALQAQLFRGDAKLEAAAVSDPAHILPGATGAHVGKIQQALVALDGAAIAQGELQRLVYGPSTADAVLGYKRKRNIINRAYQSQADNIVGRMTMAALDREMAGKEIVPTGPTTFTPLFPIQGRAPTNNTLPRSAGNLLLGFKADAPVGDTFPPLPPSLTITPSTLEVPSNQIGLFTVRNGIGKVIVCQNRSIATLAPLDLPANAHTLSEVKITQDPQIIRVFPNAAGRTSVTVKPVSLFDPFMTVIVPAEVGVFFHFLDGPAGIKTSRKEADLDTMLNKMNEIYRNNQAGITFVKSGVNPSLRVPGLGSEFRGVRVTQSGSTADTKAIKANQRANILFNVFFVGRFLDVNLDGTSSDFLALTSRPPDDDKPLRCCLLRDPQQTDPAGIDPGKTLAHEAGHALGEDDDQTDKSSLMFFSQSGARDTKISAAMAARMLSSFRQFPP